MRPIQDAVFKAEIFAAGIAEKLRNPLAIPRILTVIEDFAAGKACDVEALVDHADTHRLRVGDFRVLMTIDVMVEISWIEEVRKRDERTY